MSQRARPSYGKRREVTTRMPLELADQLARAASQLGVPQNRLVCEIVTDYFATSAERDQRIEDRARQLLQQWIDSAASEIGDRARQWLAATVQIDEFDHFAQVPPDQEVVAA